MTAPDSPHKINIFEEGFYTTITETVMDTNKGFGGLKTFQANTDSKISSLLSSLQIKLVTNLLESPPHQERKRDDKTSSSIIKLV